MRKTKHAKSKRLRHTKKVGLWDRLWRNRSTAGKIGVASLFLAGVALIVAAAILIPNLIWFFRMKKQYTDGSYDSTFSTDKGELGITENIDFPEGITNIALFGIDSRDDDMVGLSDSIMILSIDAVHNDIKLVSVVRDTVVKVEKHGYQKINAAYNLGGGPTLAVKTLNQAFNLNIMDYATVDFVGMANIIDAVGGIEATLSDKEVRNANFQINEMNNSRGTPRDHIKKSGTQKLNGIQAVAYSRIRKVSLPKGTLPEGETDWGDFARTYRQRYVMSQLFKKALELDLNELKGLIETVLPFLKTSLSFDEVFDLAKILLKDDIQMKQDRIPADDAIIAHGVMLKGLGSCVYYDLDYAAELLHAYLFNDVTFEDYIAQHGVKKNRWLPNSLFDTSGSTENEDEVDGPEEGDHTTDTSSGTGSSGKKPIGSGGGGGSGGSGGGGSSETTDKEDASDTGSSSSGSGSGSGKPTNSGSEDTGTTTDTGASGSGDSSDEPEDSSSDKKPEKPEKPENSDEEE